MRSSIDIRLGETSCCYNYKDSIYLLYLISSSVVTESLDRTLLGLY